jgi:hypothetical protein
MSNMRILACDLLAKLRFVKSQKIIVLPSSSINDGNIIIKYNNNITLNDINIILPTHTAIESSYCSICMSGIDVGNDIRMLNCNHTYHCNCIDEWLIKNPSCPDCRYHFANTQNLPVSCTGHSL